MTIKEMKSKLISYCKDPLCDGCCLYNEHCVCWKNDAYWRKCTDEEEIRIAYYAVFASDDDRDNVNHPTHYTRGGIECIDAIAAAVGELTGMEAVYTAQCIKYLWRWKWKNGAEDLNKARFYLDKLIDLEEKA